jgi:hypothetical protein
MYETAANRNRDGRSPVMGGSLNQSITTHSCWKASCTLVRLQPDTKVVGTVAPASEAVQVFAKTDRG